MLNKSVRPLVNDLLYDLENYERKRDSYELTINWFALSQLQWGYYLCHVVKNGKGKVSAKLIRKYKSDM